MIQCITSKIQFRYVVSNAFTRLLIGNLDILGQFCIFHNLNQFKLLELIAKYKLIASCLISYNKQIIEIFVRVKFIVRFSLFPTYILSTLCKLGYLLHVHKCIENFESLLFPYIDDFFVSNSYNINVTRLMY
jgi:hypothetical protein